MAHHHKFVIQVARCTKIIKAVEGQETRYMINVKQFAKFVVDLADTVAPTDIEEGMRVGVDRNKYQVRGAGLCQTIIQL
jgi:26S proteasome regulatory subunit T1